MSSTERSPASPAIIPVLSVKVVPTVAGFVLLPSKPNCSIICNDLLSWDRDNITLQQGVERTLDLDIVSELSGSLSLRTL